MSCLAGKENAMKETDRDFFISVDNWLNCLSSYCSSCFISCTSSHFCKGPTESISSNKPFSFHSLHYSLYFKWEAEEGFKTSPIIF